MIDEYQLDRLVGRLRAAGCVFAEEEAELLAGEAASVTELDRWVRRRVDGEPLETILGWAEFAGLRIAVSRGVFVPRRRSRVLVDEVIARAPHGAIVTELCCGTAAVSAALLDSRPDVTVYASDIDEQALSDARVNLRGRATVVRGDLYSPLPHTLKGKVDVIVANAPYVPTEEIANMPPEARDHESRAALDGGHDGLDLHRRISVEARSWLRSGGSLIVETSARQSTEDLRILAADGFDARVVRSDEFDGTAVVGIAP